MIVGYWAVAVVVVVVVVVTAAVVVVAVVKLFWFAKLVIPGAK
jgi:hypothetical protein